jgi:hypothetical protein
MHTETYLLHTDAYRDISTSRWCIHQAYRHSYFTLMHTPCIQKHISFTLMHTEKYLLHAVAYIMHTETYILHTDAYRDISTSRWCIHHAYRDISTSRWCIQRHISFTLMHTETYLLHADAYIMHTETNLLHADAYIMYTETYLTSRCLHQGVITVVELDTKSCFGIYGRHRKKGGWGGFIYYHCSKTRLDRLHEDVGKKTSWREDRSYRRRCPFYCLASNLSVSFRQAARARLTSVALTPE